MDIQSRDDDTKPAREVHDLLDHYRKSQLEQTRTVELQGIPELDPNLPIGIPLQRIYIHIQALEQRESQALRRAEEQALLEQHRDSQKERFRMDLFDLISRMGEYLYRHGESTESSQRPKPIDPLDAVRKYRRLVLLGVPGSGKSTLLRYLAHQTAYEQDKVAILVRLGDFAVDYRQNRQLSLKEWALKKVASEDSHLRQALRQAAASGQVLWLFDGLDEAGDFRKSISDLISQVADQAQVVVTSRPLDYYQYATNLAGFAHYEILPLTATNVEQFVRDWLTVLAEQQGHTLDWVEQCHWRTG